MFLGSTCAFAKKGREYEKARELTPEQLAMVQKAIAQEKAFITNLQHCTPMVETYIQDTKPDVKLYEVPMADHYMLSRVDFGKGFFEKTYMPKEDLRRGFFHGSLEAIAGLTRALGLDRHSTYIPNGFMDMMFLDPKGFDQQHYVFSFVRGEFLGTVRTWVFDVRPLPEVKDMGRFYGRIWVEDQGGNVVRFNGTYTGSNDVDPSEYFFHFDSWRMNVQPGVWLPVAVYVEETERTEGDKSVGLKAQTHFWGYSLKLPTRNAENMSVKVDDAVDKSDGAQEVGPLQASRLWIAQAEKDIIDRLVEAGLVAPVDPGGYEDKILGQIVINLVVPNNLAFTDPIHCRVMLTDTIEATTVGNTILISKGLLDSLPNEEAIASVLSLELAHIAMGHHIDTRFAFNDRLLFPDEATFRRIAMNHSDADNAAAAKRAIEYLEASMYKDKLPNAGLYFEQLADRAGVLKALNTPILGDSFLKPDGTPWMADLAHMAPKIDWGDPTQQAALPLGSWLKTDPWDDKVQMLNSKQYLPMNARDKMPFEVTPIFYKLQRYGEPEGPGSEGGAAGGKQSPAPGF